MATLRSLASLNETKLVSLLREKRRKQSDKIKKSVKNLLITIEHYLVAWESDDCCLLFKNLLDVDPSWNGRKQNDNKKPSMDHLLV